GRSTVYSAKSRLYAAIALIALLVAGCGGSGAGHQGGSAGPSSFGIDAVSVSGGSTAQATPSSTAARPRPGIYTPSAKSATKPRPTPKRASASRSKATASPKPTVTTATSAPPRSGGKPGAGNTGVPTGTKLRVVRGNQTFNKSGEVVTGLDIYGSVNVTAKNVTVRDSIVRGGGKATSPAAIVWVADGASLTIEDSEITPTNPSTWLDGIAATNTTILRVNIHGVVDGVKAFDNVTVEDSYIHN